MNDEDRSVRCPQESRGLVKISRFLLARSATLGDACQSKKARTAPLILERKKTKDLMLYNNHYEKNTICFKNTILLYNMLFGESVVSFIIFVYNSKDP